MRKNRFLIAAFLVLCVLFSFGGLHAAEKKVVLKFTDWQGGNEGILKSYKEMTTIFEKENPGFTVEYQQYTVTTYNEFLKPALAGGSAPDLFAVYPGPDFVGVVNTGG